MIGCSIYQVTRYWDDELETRDIQDLDADAEIEEMLSWEP